MKSAVNVFVVAALLIPRSLIAQEEGETGQLILVQEFQVEPSHIAHQNETIAQVVDAAKLTKLTDPGASWYIWTSGDKYIVVFPIENFAYLDDPMAFQNRFTGTPGEAMMKEAFASMQTIPISNNINEIAMHVPDWSYEPANTVNFTHARMVEVWLKPGQEEAFGALIKDVMAQRKRIAYPYMTNGYRMLMGDVGRFVFVTFYDDPVKFEGENSIEKRVEAAAGEMEAWQEMMGRFLQMTRHWEESTILYRPELSYDASSTTSAGE